MNRLFKKVDSIILNYPIKYNINKIQLKRALSNSSEPEPKVKRMGSLEPITFKGINLNEKEKKFSNLLLNIVQFIHDKNPNTNPPQLRFAGGWVRDKLLGKESDDIDVAIDNMTGYKFAQHFSNYMLKNKLIHKASIGKIASNPDKSKHLETATTHYEGMAIDFVHLRSETYNTDSRIPESVQFGTPWEDALRRDITINALFYNLNTGLVEDFTHKGLEDLNDKIIRTPLEPKETFLDDPLRVLRVVRFASRFNFSILKQIEETIQLPEIKDALVQKISKERVCTELTKMLKGPNPLIALESLYSLGLYPYLFDPSAIDVPKDAHIQPYANGLNASRLAYWLLNNSSYKGPNNIFDGFELPLSLMEPHYDLFKENILEILLGSYLLPFDRIDIQIPKKSKTTPLISIILTNSLKITNQVIDTTHTMSDGSNTLDQLRYLNESILDRVKIGNFIFNTKHLWPIVILYDTIYKLTPLVTEAGVSDKGLDAFQSILNNYAVLMDYIHNENLGLSYKTPLPLSGKDIAKILNIKPGKLIGFINQGVRDWCLLNPNGTKSECEEWVLQKYTDPEVLEELNKAVLLEYERMVQLKKKNC